MKQVKAILGQFTIQNIKQQIDSGENELCLRYSFTLVPENANDVALGYTSRPVIKGDDDLCLVDEMRDSTESSLREWLGMDVVFHLEEESNS